MRYVNLSTVLVLRLVSTTMRARFPTYDSMVEANLLSHEEATRLREIDRIQPYDATSVPITWAMRLIENARNEGKITVSVIYIYIYIYIYI